MTSKLRSPGNSRRADAPLAADRADTRSPAALARLADEALLDAIQLQAFRFFWNSADPASGLAPDRCTTRADAGNGLVAIGGSGFGMLATLAAIERGWVSRQQALDRFERMVDALQRATRHHGAWPHFMNGTSGATIPFGPQDDGGDLVETSFLCMGLLCARQYFAAATPQEARLRARIEACWLTVEWDWYTRGAADVLYWHWSPACGWAMNHAIAGWNECLITYVLAAASPTHAVDPQVYHRGFASGPGFVNGNTYYGLQLPLGMPYGGPLFFAHYSFCGLDPRGLRDRYADYWLQNRHHVLIHHAYCTANPQGHPGYGAQCWGLTASDDPAGYAAHAPDNDNGTISPTAALSSFPYAPQQAMQALRHWLVHPGRRIWGRYGFVDAYCERQDWFADTYLAIDQGPIVVMIENHRSGLLWKLFMSVPEVRAGLRRLGFQSPHLTETSQAS